MKKLHIVTALAAFGMFCLAGCATQNTFSGKSNPKWVDQGGGAFKDGSGNRVLYGVGVLANVRDPGLARTAVDNRAIADIGKSIQVFSTQLMRDYAASISAGDPKKSDEEQMIENTVKTFANVTLSGIQVVDHWTDHESKTYYALARLDMESFKKLLEQSNQLSEQVKEHIRKNAENAFDRLAKEEEKHQ